MLTQGRYLKMIRIDFGSSGVKHSCHRVPMPGVIAGIHVTIIQISGTDGILTAKRCLQVPSQ